MTGIQSSTHKHTMLWFKTSVLFLCYMVQYIVQYNITAEFKEAINHKTKVTKQPGQMQQCTDWNRPGWQLVPQTAERWCHRYQTHLHHRQMLVDLTDHPSHPAEACTGTHYNSNHGSPCSQVRQQWIREKLKKQTSLSTKFCTHNNNNPFNGPLSRSIWVSHTTEAFTRSLPIFLGTNILLV